VTAPRRTLDSIADDTRRLYFEHDKATARLPEEGEDPETCLDENGHCVVLPRLVRAACEEYAAGEVAALRGALDAVDAEAQRIYDTPLLREGPAGYAGGMRYATRQMRAALAKHGGVA